MERNFNNEPDVVVVTACQGYGKSTMQRNLIRAWIQAYPKGYIAIFDHKNQFAQLLPAFSCRTLEQCELSWRQRRSVCFNPFNLYEERLEEAFSDFSEWFWVRQKKLGGNVRKLFVSDELGDLLPDNWREWRTHSMRKSTNTGREWGVDILGAAQAPTDVPLKFRNQVNHWFVSRLGDEGCLEPLRKHGVKWADVAALNKGQFIHLDKSRGEFERVESKPE